VTGTKSREAIIAGTFTNLLYHVVFSTKNRSPIIGNSYRERLHQYIGGIVQLKGGQLLSIGSTTDHIHLAIKLRPVEALSRTIGDVKSNSSKWINDERLMNSHFAWQAGYGAFSFSESQLKALIGYIESQEAHHRTNTFQEEYIALLKRHNISYDLVYIWD